MLCLRSTIALSRRACGVLYVQHPLSGRMSVAGCPYMEVAKEIKRRSTLHSVVQRLYAPGISANDIHGVSLRKFAICGHAHSFFSPARMRRKTGWFRGRLALPRMRVSGNRDNNGVFFIPSCLMGNLPK